MTRSAVTEDRIMAQHRGEPASQATVIEQSRAIAEVQGMLVVAQQRPRDPVAALGRIREACKTLPLAKQAFFKFPRGGQTVQGESVHLARELVRCWGNMLAGVAELERDDHRGRSEMAAYCWDLETNTRFEMKFTVPHRRDTRTGGTDLTDARDIYENNANAGARRVRECIFAALPVHIREVAKDTCLATLEAGESEQPLAVRIAALVEAAEKLGISRARVEGKLGTVASLTAVDAAGLEISLRSIKRKEVSADEEFPRVGVEEATKAARRLAGQDTLTPESPNAEEGRAEDDRGEAHNGAQEDHGSGDDHPAREAAARIIKAAAEAKYITVLRNLKSTSSGDVAAMPDDIRANVEAAYAEAEARLVGGK